MAYVRTVSPVYEVVDATEHPEHQCINTRVSHYLRLYASGKISEFPTNGLIENPELPEGLRRDLLNRNLPLPEHGTDPVEVLAYLNEHEEEFQSLSTDYNLALDDLNKYNAAMQVLEDDNATITEKSNAVRVIEAIRDKARARNL